MKLPFRAGALCTALILTTLWATTSPVRAHEMWIEPNRHRIAADGTALIGNTRIGENFKGYSTLYLPEDFERFEIMDSAGTYPVTGRLGDRPALNIIPRQEGLAVVIFFSKDRTVDYSDWKKFADFLTSMGIAPPLERHMERGLDPNMFVESYRRAAKSLIAVGSGGGADRYSGMPFELVAQENPYTRPGKLDEALPVQLLRNGSPAPDMQVTLFHLNGATLTTQHLRTDMQGLVSVPSLGPGRYLLNAVSLIERTGPNQAPWHTIWASLTYGSE